jgi:hypothetical protein
MQSIRYMIIILVLFIEKNKGNMYHDFNLEIEPDSMISTEIQIDSFKNVNLSKQIINNNRLIQKNFEKRSFDFLKKLKNIFSLKKTDATQKSISREETCVKNLKFEEKLKKQEEKNWACKTIQDKVTNKPLLCSCSHQYDCSETKEFYFSSKYKDEIQLKNKLMNVNRGADFQCEKYLKKSTFANWTCRIKKKQTETSNEEEEYFCECLHQKTCTHDRYVEFY